MRERIELLEERFAALPRAKKWVAILTPFVLSAVVLYFFLFEPALAKVESLEERVASLSQQILQKRPARYKQMIKNKKEELLQLRTQIDRLRSQELALQTKLQRQHYLFLNGKNFAKLLEDMLQSSLKHRIDLSSVAIDEQDIDSVGKLKIKKRMSIEGVGKFLDIVRFVRSIEAHPMLLRVERFAVETNGSTPTFQTEISFFGVEL